MWGLMLLVSGGSFADFAIITWLSPLTLDGNFEGFTVFVRLILFVSAIVFNAFALLESLVVFITFAPFESLVVFIAFAPFESLVVFIAFVPFELLIAFDICALPTILSGVISALVLLLRLAL